MPLWTAEGSRKIYCNDDDTFLLVAKEWFPEIPLTQWVKYKETPSAEHDFRTVCEYPQDF